MSGVLRLRNRQRAHSLDLRLLRRITITVLREDGMAGRSLAIRQNLRGRRKFSSGGSRASLRDKANAPAKCHRVARGAADPPSVPAPPRYEISVHLVTASEISGLNQKYLRHRGSTDVITFNYDERDTASGGERRLHGDIFLCVDESVVQARRFRTTWQSELVRYLIHGILHLSGYDDLEPRARRIMKGEEDRLMRKITRRFALSKLARRPRLRP